MEIIAKWHTAELILHPSMGAGNRCTVRLKKHHFIDVVIVSEDNKMREINKRQLNMKNKQMCIETVAKKQCTEGLILHPFGGSEKRCTAGLKNHHFIDVVILSEDNKMEEINKRQINELHYCKLQTEPYAYGQNNPRVYVSRKGGYKADGTKASGCTSKISAFESAMKSVINQITKTYRFETDGKWIGLSIWAEMNPRKYIELMESISHQIDWIEHESDNSSQGTVSFAAIESVRKAVMA